MSDELNQMGLFGESVPAQDAAPPPTKASPAVKPPLPVTAKAKPAAAAPAPQRARKTKKPQEQKFVAAPRKVSGLVPEGDVRLTANIRQDLHLKLKITSAYRRTTIGEIIEELVEKYL